MPRAARRGCAPSPRRRRAPGMRRSISTRSGSSSSGAARRPRRRRPPRPRPRCRRPSASSATMPPRTMGWSSATRTRIMRRSVGSDSRIGRRASTVHGARRAACRRRRARSRVPPTRASRSRMPARPKPASIGVGRVEARAVVADGERRRASASRSSASRAAAAPRVLAHVREALLRAAQQHDLALAVERADAVDVHRRPSMPVSRSNRVASRSSAVGERRPSSRRGRRRRRRARASRRAPPGRSPRSARVSRRRAGVERRASSLPARCASMHEAGEALRDGVVDLAGQPLALARRRPASRLQRGELAPGRPAARRGAGARSSLQLRRCG